MKKKHTVKRKWFRKTIVFLIFVALSIGLVTLAINLFVKSYTKEYIKSVDDLSNTHVDCILVLGAGLYNEVTPSLMLADRVLRGIELYNSGVSSKLLMSGDHGFNNHNEVGVMREYAIARDVPSEDIFMDHAGFSTYESIYRAKYIFGAKSIVIVTQGFHIERAVYIARQFGLEAYGVTSDIRNYGSITYNQARDILARVKDFFMVIIKPKPTYLGDKISLYDSGEVTLD